MRRMLAALLLAASACSLAPIDLSTEGSLALRTTITAADGSFLARLFRQNRALVPLEELPKDLIDAVVAAEDARFFDHPGYDIKSIARAALVNWQSGQVEQGGSTITQQYVKNTFLARPGKLAPRTLNRKARELRYSIEIERRYSKREILERYLTTVYIGEGAYGVKAGAETFFGHGVGRLDLAESALLAAVIRAPAHYDPRSHPAVAKGRRDYVLDRMVKLDMISRSRRDAAAAKDLGITPLPPQLPTRRPYFVEAVKRQILEDVRLGTSDVERANALWKGGLRVVSTLDPKMQKAAEKAARVHLPLKNDPAAALVAIEPKTGHVVAMVGGKDWSQSQVNLALGREGGGSGRQPGSSFKPIAAAAAMETGVSLDSSYEAGPASFPLPDGSTWTVHNSEGTTRGLLPLNEALVNSVNGVFARLALQIGPGAIATQAELMGVEARLPVYPSIALGSAEVSVLDMATAYSTLANGGIAVTPTTIKEIQTASGGLLLPEQEQTPGAMEPGNAYLLTRVLQDVIRRGTGTAANIGRPAAGKTGTTDDHADAWFVGYTPDLVTAVWVGYPEGRVPMTSVHGMRVWGGNLPAFIWRTFMLAALKDTPKTPFRLPKNELITVEIDQRTGLLAAPWCPGEKKKMLRQLAPSETCPSPEPVPLEGPDDEEDATSRWERNGSPSPSEPQPRQEPSEEPRETPQPTPTPSE